jgi:hypothetical protein
MPDLLPKRFLVQIFGINVTHHDTYNNLVLQAAAIQHTIGDHELNRNDCAHCGVPVCHAQFT